MGAKRLRKTYEKPKKLWDKARIETERKLAEEYGLKNAREVWKMQTILRKIRREARRLLSGKGSDGAERTQKLLARVHRLLIRKDLVTLDDILSLTIRDILERRLQTVVYKKHMAKSVRQARQFIAHGHIAVGGIKISSPSYLVKFDEEVKVEWYSHALQLQPQKRESPSGDEDLSAGISHTSELEATQKGKSDN